MMSLILIEKIFSLFLIMLMGYAVVRFGVLKAEQSVVISKLTAYVIMPCIVLSAFFVEITPQVIDGLLLSAVCALLLALLPLLFFSLFRKPMHLSRLEVASVGYPNTGNLVIPIVAAVMGSEYIVYTTPFMCIMNFLMWSHGKALVSGDRRPDLKRMLSNVNVLVVFLGALMMATGLRFPRPIAEAVDSVGAATAPLVMLVTGMLLADLRKEKLQRYRQLPYVVLIRMLVIPLVFVLLYRLLVRLPFAAAHPEVLVIAVVSASTPCASTITQLAQVFGGDAEYVNTITVVETLLCIVTVPLMVTLFQL